MDPTYKYYLLTPPFSYIIGTWNEHVAVVTHVSFTSMNILKWIFAHLACLLPLLHDYIHTDYGLIRQFKTNTFFLVCPSIPRPLIHYTREILLMIKLKNLLQSYNNIWSHSYKTYIFHINTNCVIYIMSESVKLGSVIFYIQAWAVAGIQIFYIQAWGWHVAGPRAVNEEYEGNTKVRLICHVILVATDWIVRARVCGHIHKF